MIWERNILLTSNLDDVEQGMQIQNLQMNLDLDLIWVRGKILK